MALSDNRTQLLQKALPEHHRYCYTVGPHSHPKRCCVRSKGNISVPEHSCSKSSRGPSAEEKMPPVLDKLQKVHSQFRLSLSSQSPCSDLQEHPCKKKKNQQKRRKSIQDQTWSWCEYKQNSFDLAKGGLLTPTTGLPLSPQVKRGIPPSPCHVLLPGLLLQGLFVPCGFQQDPAAQRDILPIASSIWAQLETQIDHYVLY